MRTTAASLLCLALFLVIAPLTVVKPGLPTVFKADEPAYYLMARSLVEDRDLRCDVQDRRRLFDEFPYATAQNVILASDDGWRTMFFGKPYIYSLFAAPAVGLFGANGMVAFNMALLMAMVWMAWVYLRRWNPSGLAALYAAGFFLISSAFSYVFWLHPEVFMMASVAASLFLVFHRPEGRQRLPDGWRYVLSAACLACGVFHKPMLAAFGVPILVDLLRSKGWRKAGVWVLTAVLASGALASASMVFTGHPSAYLGVARIGLHIDDPEPPPMEVEDAEEEEGQTNSWWWLLRVPEMEWPGLLQSAGYFLWGRHTGLVPYLPFAVLSVLLFLLHGRRSVERWALLAALAAIALFFLVFIPFNWHGGGGFVGNRYFVIAYPAFLFLVTKIRPAALVPLGYAVGAWFLGALLLTPYGAPVIAPTLQAHVRSNGLQIFPLETTVYRKIPGYQGVVHQDVWFRGRKDVFRPMGEEMWVQGATETELWAVVGEPRSVLEFEVRNLAAENVIELSAGGEKRVLRFGGDLPAHQPQTVALPTGDPSWLRPSAAEPARFYRIRIYAETGSTPRDPEGRRATDFYVGASLRFLGSRP